MPIIGDTPLPVLRDGFLGNIASKEPQAHQTSWELEARLECRNARPCKPERGASDTARLDP